MSKENMAKNKRKKKELMVGSKVFIIDRDLNIQEKTIREVIQTQEEKKYKMDDNQYSNPNTKEELFLTKHKAEVEKKNFLDGLKFREGDLVIFYYREYHNKIIELGVITKIIYNIKSPYEIKTAYANIRTINDEDTILKVKNDYIEHFGMLEALNQEYDEINQKLRDKIKEIDKEHEFLEKDLEHSFKKQYKFSWTMNKKKPLFKDRFGYIDED